MTRVYDTPEWQRVRRQVLNRDGHECQIRGDGCNGRADQVDHIVNLSDGGAPYDPANLQAACRSCNIAKRNRELAEVARQARTGRNGRKVPGIVPNPNAPDEPGVDAHGVIWLEGANGVLEPHSFIWGDPRWGRR